MEYKMNERRLKIVQLILHVVMESVTTEKIEIRAIQIVLFFLAHDADDQIYVVDDVPLQKVIQYL
jgi:hypothetical protein